MTENYIRIRQVAADRGSDAVKAVLVLTSDTRPAMRVINATAEDTRTVMRVVPVTEARDVDAVRMLIVDEATGTPIGPVLPAVPGTWVPADLGSALVADWNASVLSNGAVASWADSKGGLAVTALAGVQPIKAANSFNSTYPGVTFDGVDDHLFSNSMPSFPTGATAGELWIVANFPSVSSTGIAVNYGNSGSSTHRTIRFLSTSVAQVFEGVSNSPAPTGTGNKIIGGSWSGTSMRGYTNGTAHVGDPVTIATLATGATRVRFGGSLLASPSNFFSGTIARCFVITGLLSAGDRQKLEGYCAHTYALNGSLPSDHPYKAAGPN